MKTSLRRFSLRLSLVAMILCLYAALPGQGLAWGQTDGEVRFGNTPDPVSYGFIYDSNETTDYSHFFVSGFTEGMAVRVQLADKANPNGVRFAIWANDAESMLDLVDGGCWIPDDVVSANINLRLTSSKVCDVEYTVSVYASMDMATAPLATTLHTVRYMNSSDRPEISRPDRISGELNTDIPFTINVSKAGFLQGQPVQIMIYLIGSYENLSLSGENLRKESGNRYYLSVPSFSASQYTLTAHATDVCGGNYEIHICDKDGNNVTFADQASFIIPIEYSAEDIAALKAIAEANPLSNDLRNFIANKEYLKDRMQGDGYNVGVRWNTKLPAQVSSFFIKDYRTHTVSSLDLSALTGLESVSLNGTRLKSLDVSALTKLRYLYLDGNDSLTWSTVKFPDPLPDNFNVRGFTKIMAGTPVDDYNSYVTSGTEIDLSAYAEVNGVKSTYQWYRVVREPYSRTEATMEAVSGKEGAFIFKGTPGEYYLCEIRNTTYYDWYMRTPEIKVARGSDDYSPVDIAALKKLAADNPNVTQLQEFVDSKGWEHENWNTYGDAVCTDWSAEELGRLTHLRIQLDWNSKDTISFLDLSAFTELKYFECERFMNIEKLDLSRNTKLEHLHVYSKNLASLDLSNCPDLQYFRFGTNSIGEGSYQNSKLSTVNLSGCTKLTELYLEYSPLASLDISSFKQLNRLEIEYCPNLKVQGFDNATRLEYLALPHTEQFSDLLKNLPANIRHLYLQSTEYALPSSEEARHLLTLGVPSNVESLDMAQYPNLTRLEVGYDNRSGLRYSTLKNYRQNVRYNGLSRYQLTSPSHPHDPDVFANGDTIDLSSEAVIDGVETVFLWVNSKYNIEEKEALKPVPGRPGVFVLDSKEEGYGNYYCKMMNTKFCEITEINYRNGWQVETSHIHVETSVPQVFAESDVATLARIVDASNNKALTEWWNSGAWQTNENSSNAQAVWNKENPRRLMELYLYQMGNSFAKEVDLLALDKLEVLSLAGNRVEKLFLPKNNTVLRSLMLGGNYSLKSLIVSEYPSLEHLDVSNTGLTALDLSNNKNLKELFLNWTMLDGVENGAPDLAAQLTAYGLPMSTTRIDLANFPALMSFNADGSGLEFTNVENPRQLEAAFGVVRLPVGEVRPGGFIAYGETIDLSSQKMVGTSASRFTWVFGNDTIDHTDSRYTITEDLTPNYQIAGNVTNPLFPGWTVQYRAWVYTCDGDANLDKQVNVQDVTATVSYILRDSANMITNFGWAEADVNYDNNVEIADVVGIVNIIRDQPVTKAGMLRAEIEAPVLVELDTDNFLTISSQVPVAGIYLELVGATEELPLVGEAAKFLQASHRNGDTLRVIGYSLDGRTIPSGKTRVLRMPAGVTLVGASFSDTKANSLKSAGDAIVTSNAPIEAIERLDAVSNYPNPFRGSTTFRYQLAEPADAVTIHVFSANGALAAVLNGLPGEVGENRHTAALTLPAGVYYYRLTAKAGRGVKASNTNILIIK